MNLRYESRIAVSINLEPGVYLLPTNSASGKSYMAKLFKEIDAVARVTSHTFPATFDASSVLDNSVRDVVLLDRYDMCTDDFTVEMKKFAEKGILLVDCKTHDFPLQCRRCYLKMTKSELVLT